MRRRKRKKGEGCSIEGKEKKKTRREGGSTSKGRKKNLSEGTCIRTNLNFI